MKCPVCLSCKQEIVDVIKESILLTRQKAAVTYIPFIPENQLLFIILLYDVLIVVSLRNCFYFIGEFISKIKKLFCKIAFCILFFLFVCFVRTLNGLLWYFTVKGML